MHLPYTNVGYIMVSTASNNAPDGTQINYPLYSLWYTDFNARVKKVVFTVFSCTCHQSRKRLISDMCETFITCHGHVTQNLKEWDSSLYTKGGKVRAVIALLIAFNQLLPGNQVYSNG